jgi:hypothetical protein
MEESCWSRSIASFFDVSLYILKLIAILLVILACLATAATIVLAFTGLGGYIGYLINHEGTTGWVFNGHHDVWSNGEDALIFPVIGASVGLTFGGLLARDLLKWAFR